MFCLLIEIKISLNREGVAMKQFYYKISILFLLIQIPLLAQNFDWEWQNPLPTGADHNDAIILSPNKFLLFGNGSAVSMSTDAGVTWSISYIDPQARDIYDAIFADQNIGYVVGTGGLIMKTTDGGVNWTNQTSGVTAVLWDVDFINADTGYAVGASGNILKTTDGGNVWSVSTYGTTTISKVHFVNNMLIFLGSASATTGRLLRSTNGGVSWDNISSNITGLDGTVRGIHFLDENTGWISNSTGKIFKTTDGGASGGVIYDIGSTTATIYEVKFIDANYGYAISTAGRVLKTTNGGTNWDLIQTASTENLFGLGILGVNSATVTTPVLIGGDVGQIVVSLDDGATWDLKSSSVSNDIIHRLWFPSEVTGYTVGGSITTGNAYGDILKTTNSGLTWTKLAFDPGYRTYSVFFHNDNVGYVGVRGPTGVHKTTNGGDVWTQLNTGTGTATSIVYDIKFFDENLGFAMYSSGQVARTTDGGANWSAISAGWGSAAGYEIFIVDANVIYICGAGGRVSKSTNGGLSFTQLSSLGTATLYSMHFFDENNGFIAASGGRLYKTTNGSTFTEIQLPVTSTLYSIRFVTTNLGWIGAAGNAFYTLDGGDNWISSHISIGSSQTIRDIRFAGTRLWVVGSDGMIIRGYTDPLIPVELTSFTASVTGNDVMLNWTTATETNNSGFTVERSQTESEWIEIGFVPGFGTSTEPRTYSYKDAGLKSGTYFYRIKQIDYNGTYTYYELNSSVEVSTPKVFALEQNYPNPFNPATKIEYSIAKAGNVQLVVFNSIGEKVAVLVNEIQQPGRYEVNFSAKGGSASGGDALNLASGVYFYKLSAGEFVSVKKMILIK
jgi:photosystem II stability/assembly factor-like uncharacterized protein